MGQHQLAGHLAQTSDAQHAQAAIQLLKSDPSVIYRISVSLDSMSSPDWNEEKSQRTEFLQAISQFITMCMPLIQISPGSAPFLVQILQWAATGFKAGSQIESVLDQALASLQQTLTQPKPPPEPTPEDKKDEADADAKRSKAHKDNMESTIMGLQAGFPLKLVVPPASVTMPPKPPQQPKPQGPPQGGPPQGPPPGPSQQAMGGPPQ
jgi:hypothetical protein